MYLHLIFMKTLNINIAYHDFSIYNVESVYSEVNCSLNFRFDILFANQL